MEKVVGSGGSEIELGRSMNGRGKGGGLFVQV